MAAGSALPARGRITMADNVLLPPGVGRAAPTAPAVASTSEVHADEGDGDSEEMADEAELAELDDAVLRSFARKIVLVPTADEDEDGGDDGDGDGDGDVGDGGGSDGDGEGAGVGAARHRARAAPAAVVGGSVAAGTARPHRREQKKARRRRKGEKREADPYGTAATADAAMRRYEAAEVAAVSLLAPGLIAPPPVPAAAVAGVSAAAGVAAAADATSSGVGARGDGAGVRRKDAVPSHIRLHPAAAGPHHGRGMVSVQGVGAVPATAEGIMALARAMGVELGVGDGEDVEADSS